MVYIHVYKYFTRAHTLKMNLLGAQILKIWKSIGEGGEVWRMIVGDRRVRRGLSLVRLLPTEGWADPGGTAIPGQPVARTEQAPIPWPRFKNQFNIQATRWVAFQILSWKEQILHMILAKRPRSDNHNWKISLTCTILASRVCWL